MASDGLLVEFLLFITANLFPLVRHQWPYKSESVGLIILATKTGMTLKSAHLSLAKVVNCYPLFVPRCSKAHAEPAATEKKQEAYNAFAHRRDVASAQQWTIPKVACSLSSAQSGPENKCVMAIIPLQYYEHPSGTP